MIEVWRGGLSGAQVDCILRPVSEGFEPVSAASRDVGLSAGPGLLERIASYGEIPGGAAVVTPAGDLACQVLIHVSVQSRDEPATEEVVERAFLNGLRRAAAFGFESLAAPPLGTGASGLEAEESARAMHRALGAHRRTSAAPGRIVISVGSAYEEDVFTRLLTEAEDG